MTISFMFSLFMMQGAFAGLIWLFILTAAKQPDESFPLSIKASRPLRDSIGQVGNGYLAIIATVDGNIHAVDGRLRHLWTSSTGSPLLSSGTSSTSLSGKDRLIPALDGSLLIHSASDGMRKTPITVRLLAEQSPFITKDHVIFKSAKQDSVIGLDVIDGSVLRGRNGALTEGSLMKLGGSKRIVPLYLGREDFSIKATDLRTNTEAFSISYSDIHPLLRNDEDDAGRDTNGGDHGNGSDEAAASLSASLLALMELRGASILSTPEGSLHFLDENGNAINDVSIELQSPATHAFLLQLGDGSVRSSAKIPIRYHWNSWRNLHNLRQHEAAISHASHASHGQPLVRLMKDDCSSSSSASLPKDETSDLVAVDSFSKQQQQQQASMIVVQATRNEDNKECIYAMEVSLQPEIDQTEQQQQQQHLMVPRVTGLLPDAEELELSRASSIDSNVLDEVHVFDSLQHELSSSSKIHLPISLQQKLRSFRGATRSILESLPSGDNDPDPSSQPLQQHQRHTIDELSAAASLTDQTRNIHQIRSLHRLEAGKVNEDFWLPLLKKRTSGEAQSQHQPIIEHQRSSDDAAMAAPQRSRVIFVSMLENVVRSVVFVIAAILLLIIVFLLWMPRRLSLFDQPESVQLSVRLLVSIIPQSRSYISDIFPDLARIEQLPRQFFSTESLTVRAATESEPETFVDDSGSRVIKVGALRVFDTVLGFGSHGTVVYAGNLNSRAVAVKRMLSVLHKSAEREISLLIKSDGHPNVVRYFIKEERHDFIYLGLQLCVMSVMEFVTKLQRHRREAASLASTAELDEQQQPEAQIFVTNELRLSLLQVAEGLAYLHSQRIVHRDIKPHNILCAPLQESSDAEEVLRGKHVPVTSLAQLGDYVLKISDMGLSKQLDRGSHSFSAISLVSRDSRARSKASLGLVSGIGEEELQPDEVGTIGWQAPELITSRYQLPVTPTTSTDTPVSIKSRTIEDEIGGSSAAASLEDASGLPLEQDQEKGRRTLNVDIFSLGCVFFFVLTAGHHPFGDWYQREANIAENRSDLRALASQPDALELIEWMLQQDPLLRPSSQQVAAHPFFWTATKRLEFLTDFSDLLEKESAESPLVLALEAGANVVFKLRWDRALDKELLDDMGKFRKYDPASVRDLLRVIRNKRHHFHELPAALKVKIGTVPVGYCAYFERRYPRLLLHCVSVAKKLLRHEKLLQPWLRRLLGDSKAFTTQPISDDIPLPSTSLPTAVITAITSSVAATIPISVPPAVSIPADSEEVLVDSLTSPFSPIIPVGRGKESADCGLQYADKDDGSLQMVIVWQGSALQQRLSCKAWWRDAGDFATAMSKAQLPTGAKKQRASHLTRAAQDFKYRTKLCSHWEQSGGALCPMRKKGKCTFAHGPLELRVKETRRDKWPRPGIIEVDNAISLNSSGGEDVLSSARLATEAPRGAESGGSEFERSFAPPHQPLRSPHPHPPPMYPPAPPLYVYYPYPSYTMYPDNASGAHYDTSFYGNHSAGQHHSHARDSTS